MFFNNSPKYLNISIIFCGLLAINIVTNPSDRAFASEKPTIYLAQTQNNRDVIAIEKLLKKNLKAYKEEDLTALMNSIHPDSPIRSYTEEFSRIAFSMYDVDYEYNNLEILELSESAATIKITQVTKKVSGSGFKDNRATSIQSLKKHNGEWKFFDLIAITDLEYLE